MCLAEELHASSLETLQRRALLIISPLHHERNPAALLHDPNGDVLAFPPPSPRVPAHTFLGTPYRQGPHPTAPCPPSHLIPSPHRPPKKPRAPNPSASSHRSIVCVGSSSARLLSGPAPQHVLYAQTDDTAALARQRQHKENNVLPRSFINTPSSLSQLIVNKGPLHGCGHLAL